MEKQYLDELAQEGHDLEEMFKYLDDLRESGVTNMFGAAVFVADEFSVSKVLSKKVLMEWMQSFGKRKQ